MHDGMDAGCRRRPADVTSASGAMRISLVADARSPIAQSWFEAVIEAGNAIQVLSTYPVKGLTVPGSLVVLPTLPVAVGRLRPSKAERASSRTSVAGREHRRANVATAPRNTPEVDLLRTAAYRETRLRAEMLFRRSVGHATQRALDAFRPDVVHALRIPYEAMLIAPIMRNRPEPFVVSTWGNDLTLFAAKSWAHRRLTRSVFRRTDCLHADCDRDIDLARQLGYTGPSVVAPAREA